MVKKTKKKQKSHRKGSLGIIEKASEKAQLIGRTLKPKVIIADDDVPYRNSLRALFEQEGFSVKCVESVQNLSKRIAKEPFDVIIIDMYMPKTNKGPIVGDAGFSGISEALKKCGKIEKHALIVVLTGYPNVRDCFAIIDTGVYYLPKCMLDTDRNVIDMGRDLVRECKRLVGKHINRRIPASHIANHCIRSSGKLSQAGIVTFGGMTEVEGLTPQGTDIVIITALDEERDVVLQHFPSQLFKFRGRQICLGKIGDYQFALISMRGKGNRRSAMITQWVIDHLNPRAILLLGLAGGIKKKNERLLGDLVIPEFYVEYDYGKAKPDRFERRYEPYRPSLRLLDLARETVKKDWKKDIHIKRPDGSDKRMNPLVHFGVGLSAEQVVTDPNLVTELNTNWPEAIGIEMEAVGAAMAVYENRCGAELLMIKGISDWADPNKADDLWRDYAADAAAAFAKELLNSF